MAALGAGIAEVELAGAGAADAGITGIGEAGRVGGAAIAGSVVEFDRFAGAGPGTAVDDAFATSVPGPTGKVPVVRRDESGGGAPAPGAVTAGAGGADAAGLVMPSTVPGGRPSVRGICDAAGAGNG
jgi:hypothetical protein